MLLLLLSSSPMPRMLTTLAPRASSNSRRGTMSRTPTLLATIPTAYILRLKPSTRPLSSDTIFTCIFHPFSTQLHFTFLTTPFFSMFILLCFLFKHSFMLFTLTKQRQELDSIGTTGHQTTLLLGYQHSETVLLWLLLNQILCWNLLCHHRMLPPLKVPDFPDTEHE